LPDNLAVFQMNEVFLSLVVVPSKRCSEPQDALGIYYGQLPVCQTIVGRVNGSCGDAG
jgi:hypothetical protein